MENARPVAIVTGGSRGIGAAIVHRLARAGYDLVATYLTDSDAADGVAASARTLGARVEFLRADLVTDVGEYAHYAAAKAGPDAFTMGLGSHPLAARSTTGRDRRRRRVAARSRCGLRDGDNAPRRRRPLNTLA